MATLRNKRKLAALNKDKWEELPRRNLAQISDVPRSQKNYITQVSEEIEVRIIKKLSQEFSGTENRIVGALTPLDDFLMNPLIQGRSGDVPERIWRKPGNELGRLPEWSSSWSRHLSEPDDTQLWPRNGHDTVQDHYKIKDDENLLKKLGRSLNSKLETQLKVLNFFIFSPVRTLPQGNKHWARKLW